MRSQEGCSMSRRYNEITARCSSAGVLPRIKIRHLIIGLRCIEYSHNIGSGEPDEIAHRRFCRLTFPFLNGIGYRVMERHSPLVRTGEARGEQATGAQRGL